MAKSISAWRRVILYVLLNIHTNVTRFIIVSNDSLYEDYPLPRIKFCSIIFYELVWENIHSSGGVNGKNKRLKSTRTAAFQCFKAIRDYQWWSVNLMLTADLALETWAWECTFDRHIKSCIASSCQFVVPTINGSKTLAWQQQWTDPLRG